MTRKTIATTVEGTSLRELRGPSSEISEMRSHRRYMARIDEGSGYKAQAKIQMEPTLSARSRVPTNAAHLVR